MVDSDWLNCLSFALAKERRSEKSCFREKVGWNQFFWYLKKILWNLEENFVKKVAVNLWSEEEFIEFFSQKKSDNKKLYRKKHTHKKNKYSFFLLVILSTISVPNPLFWWFFRWVLNSISRKYKEFWSFHRRFLGILCKGHQRPWKVTVFYKKNQLLSLEILYVVFPLLGDLVVYILCTLSPEFPLLFPQNFPSFADFLSI